MLRNEQVEDILDDCKFYYDTIRRPEYKRDWKIDPAFTYNDTRKCRQLEEKALMSNPRRRGGSGNNFFRYKTNRPLTEHFSGLTGNKNLYRIILILFLILVLFFNK